MEKHINAEEKAKREQEDINFLQKENKKNLNIYYLYKMFGLFDSKPSTKYNTSNSRLKLKYNNKDPLSGGKRRRTRRKKGSKRGTRRGGRR